MRYSILDNGNVKGPFPKKHLLEKGLNKNTFVSTTGKDGPWYPAESLEDLKDLWEAPLSTETSENTYSEIPTETSQPVVEIQAPEKFKPEHTEEPPVHVTIESGQSNNYGRFITFATVAILIAVFTYIQLKKTTSKTEDTISSVEIKQEIDDKNMTLPEGEKEVRLSVVANPQQEYNTLVDEGYTSFKSDNLEDALKKLLLADIVRQEYNLTISEQAIEIYEESIKKGDIAFGDGSIKELIPYAMLFYKVANAAKNTPEIEARIKESELAL